MKSSCGTYALLQRAATALGLWLLWTHAAAQMPIFRAKAVQDQQAGQLQTVFQDRKGWLWFGGENGLYRYDGQAFQTVPLPDSLRNDPITALFETEDRLWVGFESGNIGYLPANTVFLTAAPHDVQSSQRSATPLQQWRPQEGTPTQRISGFSLDSVGNLWIATYGEGLYCRAGSRLYHFGMDDGMAGEDIYAIACDGLGRIWAATDAGINLCAMPKPGKKQIGHLGKPDGLPDEIITALRADPEGNVWIGTYDKGICRYRMAQKELEYITPEWSYGPVTDLATFGSYELWVGTDQNGPLRLELSRNPKAPATVFSLDASHPLRRRKILALCKDREGLLWLLEYRGGIYAANVRAGLINASLPSVQAVCVDRQNRLWAGTVQGLLVWEKGVARRVLPEEQNVLSLWLAPDGNLWAGTYGNGVFVLAPDGKILRQISEATGLINGSIFSIAGDTGKVWMATLGGVTEWPLNGQRPRTELFQHDLGTGYVYKIYTDRKGTTWFGTAGKGLVRLENGKFRHFREAAGKTLKTIYSIVESPDGELWFSTAGEGLFRFNGKDFKRYSTQEHLHSMAISGLAFDGNGYLIISYKDGVDILTPATDHVAFFGASSGAPTIESNLNAICTDPYGNVWLGAQQGILRFAAFDESFVYDPEPNITAISVFLQPVDFLGKTVFQHDQNYFLFNFTGLWYTNPDLVRYRYRLEGYDHDWVISKEHFASYPNLPPGRYTFRVQASEHGEFEGTPEVQYAFRIKEPFWTQWWFVLICLAGAGALLYGFIHNREQRFLREASLRRETVESQFAALKSQINPHFLFNSFNTLITIIEENPKIAVEYVEHLSDFYRSIMVYREKDLITLNEEMELVRNFNFLLKKRYEDNFRLHEQLNGQSGYIMPLTLQMLVENAVKHNVISKARPLTVDIFLEEDYIVVRNTKQLKIKPEPSTHFGLHSLLHRYSLISSRPVIVEDAETSFTVKVPIM